ncbi:MAG: NAD+ synthase [Rickettsiales bacterium]|nr:NAD+ synthase [Rickettsiales bacterium]
MTSSLRLAIAQCNVTVGDIAGNAAKIRNLHMLAARQGVDLLVCPELSLIGYPPEDLVLAPDFRRKAIEAAQELAKITASGPGIVFGGVWEEGDKAYNAAILCEAGRIAHIQYKSMLPNYGIFDEKRWFQPAMARNSYRFRGTNLALLICEDVWTPMLAMEYRAQQVELMIAINASPFEGEKLTQRHQVTEIFAQTAGAPIVYVNLVGGQDDIVFDGGSYAQTADGTCVLQMPEFKEALQVFAFDMKAELQPALLREAALWEAMKLGLADYVRKNNFPGVLIGLSGGIDSALTAVAAADALGAASVKGVSLPSPYTSPDSIEDALELAKNLGIETYTIPIDAGMRTFEAVLMPVFQTVDWMENISVGGNLQSRLRGITLMALSNQLGFMLLSTGNKSEIAVGYSTLYGDSCGGYNLLKDLYKTEIYTLAKWRNTQAFAIPKRSITRAPSAELAPGQTDQDQLPPYDVLDKLLYAHLEERLGPESLIDKGFDPGMVSKITKLVRQSEYKRRQSCPGVKLTPMLFGKDRRYPLTSGY